VDGQSAYYVQAMLGSRSFSTGCGPGCATAVLAAVIILSHQFTAVGIAVLTGCAALAPLLRSGWPPGARVRYLIMWLLSAVAAAMLCLLWPFYSITELLGSASGFDAKSRYLYRAPLLDFCLLLLALPAVAVRVRRKGPTDPLVLAAGLVIMIAVVGGLSHQFWLGRLIPAGAIALQILAAVEMTAALAAHSARLRVGAGWRWAAVLPTALAIALGLWAQLGVFATLWPGSLPDRPLDPESACSVGTTGRLATCRTAIPSSPTIGVHSGWSRPMDRTPLLRPTPSQQWQKRGLGARPILTSSSAARPKTPPGQRSSPGMRSSGWSSQSPGGALRTPTGVDVPSQRSPSATGSSSTACTTERGWKGRSLGNRSPAEGETMAGGANCVIAPRSEGVTLVLDVTGGQLPGIARWGHGHAREILDFRPLG
jgi:hypothetical protein